MRISDWSSAVCSSDLALCRGFDAPLPAGMMVTDETAPHPDGTVPLRRYRPAGDGREARIVYFHGGGFVVGGLHSHNAICAELAEAAGAELVADRKSTRLNSSH